MAGLPVGRPGLVFCTGGLVAGYTTQLRRRARATASTRRGLLRPRAEELDKTSGGFQISRNQYDMLKSLMKQGAVRVHGKIDATLGPGKLTLVHAFTTNLTATLGGAGAFGLAFGYAISIAVCTYAWKLKARGVLL